VIRRYIVSTTLALACGSVFVAAQQPSSGAASSPAQEGQRPATPTPSPSTTTAGRQASATFVGCLYAESAIPGRTPNAAERAGVREDYILANATMGSSTTAGATPGAAGTSGTTREGTGMYKIENIPDERLKPLVGKRVEVMGRLDTEGNAPAGAASPNRNVGPDAVSLSEIEATGIKEVAGTCPATPSAAPGAATPRTTTPGAPTPGGPTTTPGANTPR
jgi:hypothetical protein